MCAVVGVYRRPGSGDESVLPQVLKMLLEQGNRGRDGWGIASYEPEKKGFRTYLSAKAVDVDAVALEPSLDFLEKYSSTAIIGHDRYATSGSVNKKDAQPVQNDPAGRLPAARRLTLGFNGNIANAEDLRNQLKKSGIAFEGTTDTEVLFRLIESIAQRETGARRNNPDYEKIFREVDRRIDGACSLVMLGGEGDMVLYRSRLGIRPLLVMETLDGLLVAASETHAFRGLRGSLKEVPPGEIAVYRPAADSLEHKCVATPDLAAGATEITQPEKLCVFEALYLQRADSQISGRSNNTTRIAIGRAMADNAADQIRGLTEEQRANILIVPVPNTGIPYAEGFFQRLHQLGLVPDDAYNQAIERIHLGRGFMGQESKRSAIIENKHSVIEDNVAGKSVWLCDDSFFRGETSRIVTRKVREAGAAEVHWAIGSPPVIASDYYGINTPTLKELAFWEIAQPLPPDERARLFSLPDPKSNAPIAIDLEEAGRHIAEYIGADSINFLPLEKLQAALPGGADYYNASSFTGVYPTPAAQKLFNANLRHLAAA